MLDVLRHNEVTNQMHSTLCAASKGENWALGTEALFSSAQGQRLLSPSSGSEHLNKAPHPHRGRGSRVDSSDQNAPRMVTFLRKLKATLSSQSHHGTGGGAANSIHRLQFTIPSQALLLLLPLVEEGELCVLIF